MFGLSRSRCWALLFFIGFQATVGLSLSGWAEGEEDPLWNRPSFEKKVLKVGHRILAANGITERIQFHSVTRDVRNATSSRFGGPNQIVIYKDLLDVMDSDDELAAVLSHEIAHITKRHTGKVVPRKWAAKTALWSAYTVGGTAATLATGGLAGPFVLLGVAGIRKMNQVGIGFTDPLSRPYEREADLVGLDYMVKAGYSPLAMETLMGKLAGDSGPVANFFASHPGGTERLTYIHEAIQASYPQYLDGESVSEPVSEPLSEPVSAPSGTLQTASGIDAKAPVLPLASESPKSPSQTTLLVPESPVSIAKSTPKPEKAVLASGPVLPPKSPETKLVGVQPASRPVVAAGAAQKATGRSTLGPAAVTASPLMVPSESVAQVLLTLQPSHLGMLRLISQRGYLSRHELTEQMEYMEPETLSVQVQELVQKRLIRLLGAEPDEVMVLTEWAAEAMKPTRSH
ncbi:M48 family metalloprotease [Vampirovibrio sp.]|uniref:M48 family metalloprotease n=1 Tax=Vampirovibrio sp. TaxID=2717857 RepID=UPI0035933058